MQRDCKKPLNKNWHRKKHHASVAIEKEQPQLKKSRGDTKDPDQEKEYFLASTLTSTIPNLLDS